VGVKILLDSDRGVDSHRGVVFRPSFGVEVVSVELVSIVV